MRISIGIKIFSVAVFLAGVMIVAALLSESRVRQAQIRIDVLAEHLLLIAEKSNDLRTVAIHETLEFRNVISSEGAADVAEERRAQKRFDAFYGKFISIAAAMHAEIDAAIEKLPSADKKMISRTYASAWKQWSRRMNSSMSSSSASSPVML